MRQSLAKGVRRDLRRAIGSDALAQVEVLDRAVTILQSSVVGLQRELASLAVNHAEAKNRSERVDENLGANILNRYRQIETLERALSDQRALLPIQSTFTSRLRWLFNL